MNHIVCDVNITYENGAVVRTAFVTSFGGDIIAQTAPSLRKAIDDAVDKIKAETRRELPRYAYPDHILTAAMLQRYSHYGIDFCVRRASCTHVSKLDCQKEVGKSIYGCGLLLSDSAAADRAAAERAAVERAAAERAAAHVLQLSDREREMVGRLK